MRYGGWYQVAFERDLKDGLASVRVSERRILCARTPRGIEVFDGVCPHRGADLGVSGALAGDAVTCGYHGHRIALGDRTGGAFCVHRHPSFVVEGLVFALLGRADEGELPAFLRALLRTHRIVPGFEKSIRVAPELVIENAFDADHFQPVHDVLEVTPKPPTVEKGVFTVETTLRVGVSAWQGGDGSAEADAFIDVPLHARAFSPNLTITSIALGGDHPHFVIAAATPQPDGSALVRLSVAMPLGADGAAPEAEVASTILEWESFGLEQDRPVWENLTPGIAPKYVARDATVVAFRRWCEPFLLEPAPAAPAPTRGAPRPPAPPDARAAGRGS
jgi:phenylpropionate dioxygenase-like ring-hydroxylating dioxygenase large terminal subunit